MWNFHGECIHAAVNFPGSWHDSLLAAASNLFYPLLTNKTLPGYSVLSGSSSPRTGRDLEGKILRSQEQNELGNSNDIPQIPWLAAVDTMLERAIPSERQSAEWGVRALKCPFKRLTVPLLANVHNRYRRKVTCVHLYSFRVRFVGLNQPRTVYTNDSNAAQP